jgi:hypothetical protein
VADGTAGALGGRWYAALTTGMIAWIDKTLPEVTRFAEALDDWKSVVFCALQQIRLAPMGDGQEVNRRAEIARSYIRKLPVGEQQSHFGVVDQQVTTLLESPPQGS